jgi:hypothetical protein
MEQCAMVYIRQYRDNMFKRDIQQLKKAEIAFITTVTEREGIIKYL